MNNHVRANSYDLTSTNVAASGNEFTTTLPTPNYIPWTNLALRAEAIADGESGLGVLIVPVKLQSH